MQAFAIETGLAETTFVQTAPSGSSADYVNRIFTVVNEMPFAGHPSLGTAVAVAHERGDTDVCYVQRTHAGEQPVDVQLDGRSARASMLQEPATFGDEADRQAIVTASGLSPDDLDPAITPRYVTTGAWHLIVVLRDPTALDRVQPGQPDALSAALQPGGGICLYLAAPHDAGADPARWHARSFFLGTAGVREDPATGSAAGPLCAYIAREIGVRALTVEQGVAMGRPSVLDAALEGDRARVSGDVHVISTGTVHLPQPAA